MSLYPELILPYLVIRWANYRASPSSSKKFSSTKTFV